MFSYLLRRVSCVLVVFAKTGPHIAESFFEPLRLRDTLELRPVLSRGPKGDEHSTSFGGKLVTPSPQGPPLGYTLGSNEQVGYAPKPSMEVVSAVGRAGRCGSCQMLRQVIGSLGSNSHLGPQIPASRFAPCRRRDTLESRPVISRGSKLRT